MTYLTSLGIPDRLLTILIASGPWSGLLVPPAVAVINDRCRSWRLLVVFGGVGVTTSLLCLASAGSLNNHDAALGRAVAGITICTMNIFIIILTPLCPRACRTFKLFTVQENRALVGRVKNLYR